MIYGKDETENYKVNFTLLDCEEYAPYDDYDMRVRGEIKNISNQNYWSNKSSTKYNKNQRQSEILTGKNRRVIKMSGYYK